MDALISNIPMGSDTSTAVFGHIDIALSSGSFSTIPLGQSPSAVLVVFRIGESMSTIIAQPQFSVTAWLYHSGKEISQVYIEYANLLVSVSSSNLTVRASSLAISSTWGKTTVPLDINYLMFL